MSLRLLFVAIVLHIAQAGCGGRSSAGLEDQSMGLATQIKNTFGDNCSLHKECGALLGIDCQSAADGPYYYVKKDTLEVVARCGGFCMGGHCTNCPPAGWTCGSAL
jgi:hypothetical protein